MPFLRTTLAATEGHIRTLLKTGKPGGKRADLTGLFVGLYCSVRVPSRDVYGIRLMLSASGYKKLSGNRPASRGAQHCRFMPYLKYDGWVAIDPADVATVMRLETTDWIKNTGNPLVAPVNKALFNGWDGN